jgi:hypothetical protein
VSNTRVLGVIATIFYAAHAIWHIAHGHAWDLFWACNIAMPILAIGCFLNNGRLVAAALMILTYGTPIWLLDLATGAGMVLTSPLVHFGGPLIAVLALRHMRWPHRAWLFTAGLTALMLLTARLITPSAENVNLAFRVHEGWEKYFPNHIIYVAIMWSSSALVFFLTELALRRFFIIRRQCA